MQITCCNCVLRNSLLGVLLAVLVLPFAVCAGEFRGLWVDAFHPGFWRTQQVANLITDTRAMHCNTVLPEVRKRGDAYYQSSYEPSALREISSFDPLAELVQRAHDTNSGPRVEVHAWMVVYPVWRAEDGQPKQTNHVFHVHRDWMDQSDLGVLSDGREYHLDPGHPEVQRHLFNVAMEIVSHYDVDGLNFDYLRYPGNNWGYNPISVARFNRLYGRAGQPAPGDTNWIQFRRDQVTALLRKIYLSAIEIKPDIKISAAVVAWAPVPKDDRGWFTRSAAYTHVFQDWCGWMKEGILDINIPMVYLNHLSPANKDLFSEWVRFAVKHGEDRHVVISPACYLNTIAGAMDQIRLVRGSGNQLTQGVCLYSYAAFSKEQVPRYFFQTALTKPGGPNRDAPPVFAEPVAPPVMPWKTAPVAGHLKGFVYGENKTNVLDGATVILKGAQTRTTTTDATGFYGFVGVQPGDYSLQTSFPAHKSANARAKITVGKVATVDVRVPGEHSGANSDE